MSIEIGREGGRQAASKTITNNTLVSAWEITKSIAAFLLPPGCVLIVGIAGMLALPKHRGRATALFGIALLCLYLLSMPYVGHSLLELLDPPFSDPARQPAEAIVALGGSKYYSAPEYGGDTVGASELARLRYAARLQRTLDKPLLVTGGSPEASPTTEAATMKSFLEQELHVPVRWMEDKSTTTDENARFSYRLLQQAGIRRIYLVTDAWHMRRARAAFEHAGFVVVPAPTGYATHYRRTVIDFLPAATALSDSSIFFHEVIGIAWYRVKFVLAQ